MENRNSEIVRLWLEGNTYGQIAKVVGLTRGRVHQIVSHDPAAQGYDYLISVQPRELLTWLEAVAERTGRSQQWLIQMALTLFRVTTGTPEDEVGKLGLEKA